MFYKFKCKFKCESCGKTFEVETPIKAYDAEKGKQTCPACNGKMERVIEWCGMAESTNKNGWFGKSDGSNAI